MKSWISSAIIYQVNLRSLAAREPRNAIEAAREKETPLPSPLAYVAAHVKTLRALGANVLYLMPPYPIGIKGRKGIGSPYAIRDFRAVEPEYGTLDELSDLVRKARKNSMRVILDITPNHTSRDHAWCSFRPEYYVRNEQGDLFHDCDWTDTAKLDYTQPALREEMIAVYDYWLSFLGPDAFGRPDGVDGFRLDMAHFINDRGFWNEALPKLRARHAHRELLFLAECYGTQNNMDLFGRGINAAYDDDFYKACLYFYALDENGGSMIAPAPETASSPDFLDKYEAFRTGGIAGAFETALLNYESLLPPGHKGPFLARYTDNHDEGRGVYRFGEGAVRAVNCLIFMCSHCIPFLLTGQEFGAMNRPSIHERISPCDKGLRIVRPDGLGGRDGVEFEGNLFARGYERRREWFRFYRDLISLRSRHRELQRGRFFLLDAGESCAPNERCVVAFERRYRGSPIRCAVNLGPELRTLKNAPLFSGDLLYGGLKGDALPPFSAVAARVQ